VYEARYTFWVTLRDFFVWRHTWRKNWVNSQFWQAIVCLRTVFSNRLSQRELRSSLRESHSFLSLSADITMASSQGTSASINSFSRWASHDIFLFKQHFLLYNLRFLFFFSDNIWQMWLANTKGQPCFYRPYSHAQEDTELTKNWQVLMGNLCWARKQSVQFFVQFFIQLNCTV